MKTLTPRQPKRRRIFSRRSAPAHNPREARPEDSQFNRTGWIAQPVHLPTSLQRLASVERAAADRRFGNRWLLLNMETFNFASGWNQIVARAQTKQFSR